MYFTDRGIEELLKRRGDDEVTLAWVAERLQDLETQRMPERLQLLGPFDLEDVPVGGGWLVPH